MFNKLNNDRGFALVLSMVMLLAMTLMGSVLLMNATNQSKVTGASETSRQTFLSAETGVESARRWLTKEFEAKREPKDGTSKITNICDYQLDGSYGVAGNDGTSNFRGIKMSDELFVTSTAEKLIYDNQYFTWFVTQHSTDTYKGSGIGGSIGGGPGYVGGGGNMTTVLYKIFSCGKGLSTQGAYNKTVVEAIVGINK